MELRLREDWHRSNARPAPTVMGVSVGDEGKWQRSFVDGCESMAKHKKVLYQVVCPNDPKHVFPFAFEIEAGSEKVRSEVQAYCPGATASSR